MSEDELISEIYSAFEPFNPPPEGTYVNCDSVRGRWNVRRELGNQIVRSQQPTCQLYSGHRGVGKTTELLQLKDFLMEKGYEVVYFEAQNDVELQDAEYADILLACTKNLVQAVRLKGDNPLLNWMKTRWQSLRDLALTEVEWEGLSVEQQVGLFSKMTASIRAVPDLRRELRKRLNDSTPSLIEALNSFVEQAKAEMPLERKGIVIIADNLDRIAENTSSGRSNFDEIYLNRSELMSGLSCHVIYTVPIQMIYSPRVTRLENNYGKPDILPMVMVKSLAGELNPLGIDKLREIVCRRLGRIDARLSQPEYLENYVFDSAHTLNRLCEMSGGHMRVLMQLLQKSIDWIETLPITAEAAQIAIEEQRDTYRTAIMGDRRLDILTRTHATKKFDGEDISLEMLLNRCLVEYRYYDENNQLKQWCDVHPLVEGFEKFKEGFEKFKEAFSKLEAD